MTDSQKKDFNPKHRVVGAVVLVASAVIVLPWVLHDGDREWRGEDQTLAATENHVFVADLTQIDAPTEASEEAPRTGTPPVPAAATPTPTPAAHTPPAPKHSPVAAIPAPKPVARAVAGPADKGFYVQVGTFGSDANARQLADKLKRHGYRVHLEQIRLASGNALRVSVGPYVQDAQAQAARAAIKRKLDVQGIVRAY